MTNAKTPVPATSPAVAEALAPVGLPAPERGAAALVHPFEAAFKAALKDIRGAGVKAHVNLHGTAGEIGYADLGLSEQTAKTTAYLWHDATQGSAFRWINGLPYYRDGVARALRRSRHSTRPLTGAAVKVVYFNHGGPDLRAATVAADTFRAHGLTVDWDGTRTCSVMVLTPFHDPSRASH